MGCSFLQNTHCALWVLFLRIQLLHDDFVTSYTILCSKDTKLPHNAGPHFVVCELQT